MYYTWCKHNHSWQICPKWKEMWSDNGNWWRQKADCYLVPETCRIWLLHRVLLHHNADPVCARQYGTILQSASVWLSRKYVDLVDMCKELSEDNKALSGTLLPRLQHAVTPMALVLNSGTAYLIGCFLWMLMSLQACTWIESWKFFLQFYDDELGRVITQPLASRKVNIANATTLMVRRRRPQSNGMCWETFISILVDNCAVMRG